jgi:hypothetical protein
MLRKKMLNGNTELVQADVLSSEGNVLRVKPIGARQAIEVDAADVLPVSTVFGTMTNNPRKPRAIVPKMYPESRHALGNRF